MRITIEPGMKFNRWTVTGQERAIRSQSGRKRTVIRCRCNCGQEKDVCVHDLTRADGRESRSCGCFKRDKSVERNKTHGDSHNPSSLYSVWASMIQRCCNPKRKSYSTYGARGIHVCERWKSSYELFKLDMGPRPKGATLERLNNDGDYCPENCRWRSRRHQSRNQSRNRFYTHNGLTLCMKDWADRLGMSYWTLRSRLDRGASFEDAIADRLL